MPELDLTPFGFTPTENAVYRALLDRGPSGGYPLSNALGIARANVYQALRGLVGKDAAILVTPKPAEYRAVRPDALYARIADRQALLLQNLEEQISASAAVGEPTVVPVESTRSFVQIVMRDAARNPAEVRFVAPSGVLRDLTPVWRKRIADERQTLLWSIGEAGGFQLELEGVVPAEEAMEQFQSPVGLYVSGSVATAIAIHDKWQRGYWTDEPLLSGLVGASIARLISPLT